MRKLLKTRILGLVVAGAAMMLYVGCFIVEPSHSHGRPSNNYYIHDNGNPQGGENYRGDEGNQGNQGKHKGKRKHR